VIHNRFAGGARRKQEAFERAMSLLTVAGWELELVATAAEGHASDIAREAVSAKSEVVVAAGGDGTVNEVIQGLAHTSVALGVLPIGTVNVWSREAGFSSDVVEAARQLSFGRRVLLDLGKAGSRYFLLMAGIGFDAEVTATLGNGSRRKQQLRILPYVLRTVQVLPKYRGARIEIELDGRRERHDALMVLASNTRLYAGLGKPSPSAVANDGMLDVRVFRGRGPAQSVRHIARFLLQSRSGDSETIRARRITVNASPPLAVQVDGDSIGNTPIEISVQPQALNAIVPADHHTTLIGPAND